jgi:enoyl-CoA hydratase/carnithine racemase
MADTVLRALDEEGVLLVTLNRPAKKNAFDDSQWDGLRDALNDAREDPRVAVVVVTGAGSDFSAGQDLTAFGQSSAPREDGHPSGYYGCMEALVAFDKPLLAAAGVGSAPHLFLRHRVSVERAVATPFVSLGLVPEGASSYLLQQVIGSQRAAELFYTAEWIEAGQAVKLGMAAGVFPDAQLLEATLAVAREIAQHPVSALQATKRTLLRAHRDGIRAAFEAEDAGMKEQAGSAENVEAIRAFLEKRKPNFKGK